MKKIINQTYKIKNLGSIITIGNFDGLHLAHRKILNLLRTISKNNNLDSILFTFKNHPMSFFTSKIFKVLTTNAEKFSMLQNFNINYVVFQDFTKNFANISAESFIRDILIENFNMKMLIMGDDHKIGKNAQGDFNFINKLTHKYKFKLDKIDAIFDNNLRISSSNIRNAIKNGDMETANSMLGYEYFLQSTVGHGNKIGRKIKFPTANIIIPDTKIIPQNGVYVVKIIVNNLEYGGMCNIGFRPTINYSKKKIIETHIFNFDKNIYNEKIIIKFIKKIRPEKQFKNKDELIEQLNIDKKFALKYL